MHATLSPTGLNYPSSGFLGSAFRPDTAFSSESKAVFLSRSEAKGQLESSVALFGQKTEVIASIWNLRNEHGVRGWDGDDAAPVNCEALFRAEDFIRALPTHLPMPEIGVDPDGAVAFDWIFNRNRAFSLSIGQSNRLAYAWFNGTDRGHAVARFEGDSIPRLILNGIAETMGTNASVRTA